MQPGNGRWVQSLRERRQPLDVLMREIIEFARYSWLRCCDSPPDWEMLLSMDFQADFARLSETCRRVFTDDAPFDKITGLYFSHLPVWKMPDGGLQVCLNITGSMTWGNDHDWAQKCHYVPEESAWRSEVMTAIHRSMMTADPIELGEGRDASIWLCWQYAGLVVTEWCATEMRTLLRGGAPSRMVFVGLDPWMGFQVAILD